MTLHFAKYEGLGNDFIVLDEASIAGRFPTDRAVELCDRHVGIGADGVLLVRGGEHPRMQVINADGSIAEACGNGIRCVALYLRHSGSPGETFSIDTDAGMHRCRIVGHGDAVEVAMASPVLDPALVPVIGSKPVIDEAFEIRGERCRVTAVSMGNPHAVSFDECPDYAELGPLLSSHPRFPNGCNANFARLSDSQQIEVKGHERGAGGTSACGTGACATAVAAVVTRRCERGEPSRVGLRGGELSIVVGDPGESVRMTGPARRVFSGTL